MTVTSLDLPILQAIRIDATARPAIGAVAALVARIADDGATAGVRRTQTRERPGNPVRGAKAVVAAVDASDPPFRLLLGGPALELAYRKLDTMRAKFDAWKETMLGADYPEDPAKA